MEAVVTGWREGSEEAGEVERGLNLQAFGGEFWNLCSILTEQTETFKVFDFDFTLSQSLREKMEMTKRDSILKRRDITLLTNVSLVKAMVFPVVMTVKKAEH